MRIRRWRGLLMLWGLSLLLSGHGLPEPPRPGDFALLDHTGAFHQLSRYTHKKALVLISQANGCSRNHSDRTWYHLLRTTFGTDDVAWAMLNASGTDRPEAVRREAAVYGYDMPVLLDESQLVAESLGISQAGQVLIIDPATRNVHFIGPVDQVTQTNPADKITPLGDTLKELLVGEGSHLGLLEMETEGCALDFPARDKQAADVPDYSTVIAPLIAEKCANCHRPGGIGTFPLNSHAVVKALSSTIRQSVMTKRMPPARVDPHIRRFTNARYLSAAEEQMLIHWLDAGAPRGDGGEDPLQQLKWPDGVWDLGEPDMKVLAPETEIPAEGVLDYLRPVIPLNHDRDVWIRAIQVRPRYRSVTHHVSVLIVPPGYDRATAPPGTAKFMEGYAPGKFSATTFPAGTGVFLPKGYGMYLSLHYTPNGRAVTEQTEIGLYLHDEPPAKELITSITSLRAAALNIPPGVREHKLSMDYLFPEPVILRAIRPHMHTRGKYMNFRAVLPDLTVVPLLSVPDYNPDWQPTYRLAEPLLLPAGTRVLVSGAFDNSETKPGNLDPSATVVGGLQNADEMFVAYFTYTMRDGVR